MLDRAFRILGAFEPDRRTLTLTSLAARTGLPKATTLRMARKLVEWGALERAGDGGYLVGLRLLEVASRWCPGRSPADDLGGRTRLRHPPGGRGGATPNGPGLSRQDQE